MTVRVLRARLAAPEGRTKEWRNATIPAYQRLTRRAEALIAGAYLSGTNTRRVRRALSTLFGGAVGRSAQLTSRPEPIPAGERATINSSDSTGMPIEIVS